jgi:uncharacterized protein (DUF1810 family)
MKDDFNLQRFVDAQEAVYNTVKQELARGAKKSHWMWFVFPQVSGLGSSATATKFGISGLDEARAYLAHPVLGARLRECTGLLVQLDDRSLDQIFGYPDNLKFQSSMTLFSVASDGEKLFDDALEKYCSGRKDSQTLRLIG